MAKREHKIYNFSFKKKEIVAILSGLVITYIMVFLLGIEVGKDLYSGGQIITHQQMISLPETKEEKEVIPVVVKKESTTPQKEENTTTKAKSNKVGEEIPVIKPVKNKIQNTTLTFRIFIQAGAFSKKSYAENLSKRLKERGYRTNIKSIGGLYKVILGPYSNEDEAKKDLLKLKKDEKIYGYIVRL